MRVHQRVSPRVSVSYGTGAAVLAGVLTMMVFLAVLALAALAAGLLVIWVVAWWCLAIRTPWVALVWSLVFEAAAWSLMVLPAPHTWLFWVGVISLLLWSILAACRVRPFPRRSMIPVADTASSAAWRPYSGFLLDDRTES